MSELKTNVTVDLLVMAAVSLNYTQKSRAIGEGERHCVRKRKDKKLFEFYGESAEQTLHRTT
ncbi:hypothetical protein M514_20753 [Trichuris suis]|uniref:Uncharacterized protein n=1 Tax=Trichuris suis TaxID=68888 RepID=A0A085NCD7_9BILA|nr:hypothetical protein M514_20753 [Trichuris suis]